MMMRLRQWANSIHAHMLAMAFGVIATLTLFSLSILFPPIRKNARIHL